jgi:general secretion pathway protein F/type IV pilus assembly protein PilC
MWERWRLRIPVIGKVIRTVSITRFCRIFGTMMANGVPILQALAISKDAAGSVVLAEHIDKAAESVRGGQTLTAPLRACGLFPPQVLEMIAVAEESNQLDKVLVEIADTVERRTDRQVDQAVHLIEPVVLVLMAITIGTLALGLLYPILTMAQSIK